MCPCGIADTAGETTRGDKKVGHRVERDARKKKPFRIPDAIAKHQTPLRFVGVKSQ